MPSTGDRMRVAMPRITYDAHGTPGIWAEDVRQAYAGIGWLHGKHRPLQTLLLTTAGRGELAGRLLPRRDLLAIDLLVARLDLPARGRREAEQVPEPAAQWLDSYLAGVTAGLAAGGTPFELRLLLARLPPPDRSSVLSGLMLAAYLGLAQSQERMERMIVDALAAGADEHLLADLFRPHLAGWRPEALRGLGRRATPGFAAHPLLGLGGSNAWAVSGERSHSGKPMLCCDPHLQVNQLPALMFEIRARVGNDAWLGATIPGLPGMAVGRNRSLAWGGTFSVADNVDFVIETLAAGKLRGGRQPVSRQVEIQRRYRSALRVSFTHSEHGALEDPAAPSSLAVRWCGAERAGEALAAYMMLPTAHSVAEAERVLSRAHTYSLHFVTADAGGEVRTQTLGRVPRRTPGWSGLYPVEAGGEARWLGYLEGDALPRSAAVGGMVVSANEDRLTPGGISVSTLAQPTYRLERITELLRATQHHDAHSLQAIQLDLMSRQGLGLRPLMMKTLQVGPLRDCLAAWDGSYDRDSRGAHAFELAYQAAWQALAPELGGAWWLQRLKDSELPVWWCAAVDRLLAHPAAWQGERGARLSAALQGVASTAPARWGEVQQMTLSHMVLGGLWKGLGFDVGPLPLEGSRATVKQGNLISYDGATIAVAPAYRFVCDLADDGAWTAMPGGVDGSRFASSYARWLADWQSGAYHRLAPPAEGEST